MYNNYGNPYYMPNYNYRPNDTQFVPQTVPQTNTQITKSGLQGKSVDSIDVVRATDIPMDGSVSYFPIADGSAIVTKQLGLDGASKITIFKPVSEAKDENKYITSKELEKALNDINFDEIEDIREELKDIKKQIKNFKSKKVSE